MSSQEMLFGFSVRTSILIQKSSSSVFKEFAHVLASSNLPGSYMSENPQMMTAYWGSGQG